MNIKRIFFWAGFIIILVLIVWGLIVAGNKEPKTKVNLKTPSSISDNDHVKGPEDAPVTIIEYSDFECPACQMYYFVMERLLASSTIPIRFAYRHFPLSYHVNAVPASLASEAGGRQGKFWEMYSLIFENYTDWTGKGDASDIFAGYARDLGLDMEKYNSDITDPVLRKKISDNLEEGISIGVNATPTFFVNGKVITNPSSYNEFLSIIEKASQESSQ